MAKILYAGTASDFAVAEVTVPASAGGTVNVLKLNPGAPLEAWGAGSGGSQITDIALFTGSYTSPGGAAPSGIFPAEASSTFLFWAEDTLDAVYVTGQGAGIAGGQRWLARPVNDTARLRALEALAPIPSAQKGAVSGVATLDGTGKVPSAQLPASGVSGVADITTPVGGTESGNVVLNAADLGAVPTTRTITPGTGLTGGGDLSANRSMAVVFGTTAGTVAQGNDARFGTTGTSPRPVYAVVLSADAPLDRRTAAASDPFTYVCDGTADQVQIQAAIDAAAPLNSRNGGSPLAAGQLGKVVLSGGQFNISSGINMRTAVHVQGAGWLTVLRAVGITTAGMFQLANANDHACQISDMFLDGNGGSGGTASAINFDMTASGNTTGYPNTNPDSYHQVHGLYISQFSGSNRHGIWMHASGTANNRGNRMESITMRDCGGNGIYLQAASDCTIANVEIGGSDGSGFRIETGNTKLIGCKSFYSDVAGFYFSSGRGTVTGCESQDDAIGFYFDGAPYTSSALTVDTNQSAGIRLSSDDTQIAAFSVFNRGGGRYATTSQGLYYDGTYADLNLTGQVVPALITTPIAGAPGARSFVRVSNGTTLVAVG
jgi:hypothetical protein